jgi:hypothetical protein
MPVPADGAKAQVRKTSLVATANDDGYFSLGPISQTEGELLVTLDIDDDGRPDRQRLFTLKDLGTGPGRNVALGQVTLGLNATAVGKALRADVTTRGGHGATGVLVPEGPYATTTADDGSFLLPDLPEGPVTVAFFGTPGGAPGPFAVSVKVTPFFGVYWYRPSSRRRNV